MRHAKAGQNTASSLKVLKLIVIYGVFQRRGSESLPAFSIPRWGAPVLKRCSRLQETGMRSLSGGLDRWINPYIPFTSSSLGWSPCSAQGSVQTSCSERRPLPLRLPASLHILAQLPPGTPIILDLNFRLAGTLDLILL